MPATTLPRSQFRFAYLRAWRASDRGRASIAQLAQERSEEPRHVVEAVGFGELRKLIPRSSPGPLLIALSIQGLRFGPSTAPSRLRGRANV